ncbi:MAG: hypothetical protein GY711_17175 [bacterium]|nr:hypothetical protein [bacterium]
MRPDELRRRLPHLELAGVLLLVLAGLVPRVGHLDAGFDRELDGFQGAFFAIAAVNYERFGATRFRGYPALIVDTHDTSPADLGPADALVYANHPPLVPLLGWASLKATGPAGWNEAWRTGAAPEGIELPLRLPFFVFHLLGLVAFWWALRAGLGAGTAMIGLALMTQLPVSILYAGLVNYENPALPFVLLATGLYARLVQGAGRAAMIGFGLCFGAGCAITFAPAFFLLAFVADAGLRRTPRLAARIAIAGGAGVAVPVLVHAFASAPAGVSIVGRARVLFAPLVDGSYPLASWVANQAHAAWTSFGPAVTVCAALGLALTLARRIVPALEARLARYEVRAEGERRVDVVTPLCVGAGLYFFAFYRHTFEEQRSFLLFAAPGAVAAAAFLVQHLAHPLFRLRAGIAPLVLVTASIALAGGPALMKMERAYRTPAVEDGPAPDEPLPPVRGEELAEILPPGTIGIVPAAIGWSPALAFYAWRNLVPESDPLGPPHPLLATGPLASAERWVLLPTRPPAAFAAECARLREQLDTRGSLEATTQHWTAWSVAP